MLGENLIYQLQMYVDQRLRQSSVGALNLNPAGGLTGLLPQTRVAYDSDEDASSSGSSSLEDNLNHIRYNIEALTSGSSLQEYQEATVSEPPSAAELDTTFGAPETLGNGFLGVLSDVADSWLCWTSSGSWFYAEGTPAT